MATVEQAQRNAKDGPPRCEGRNAQGRPCTLRAYTTRDGKPHCVRCARRVDAKEKPDADVDS